MTAKLKITSATRLIAISIAAFVTLTAATGVPGPVAVLKTPIEGAA